MLKRTLVLFVITLQIISAVSCDFNNESEAKLKENKVGLFEGEIVFKQRHRSHNSKITYLISKDTILREQTEEILLLPKFMRIKAGMVVDIPNEKVVLYTNTGSFFEKHKCTLSFSEFKAVLKENMFPEYDAVSSYDYFFSYLENYTPIIKREDVINVGPLQLDYTFYKNKRLTQEVFDSPSINVNKKVLPIIFPNIPKTSHFPMGYLVRYNHTINDSNSPSEKDSEEVLQEKIKNTYNNMQDDDHISLIKLIDRKINSSELNVDLSSYKEVYFGDIISDFNTHSSRGGFGDD